jgi:hypothetical protein
MNTRNYASVLWTERTARVRAELLPGEEVRQMMTPYGPWAKGVGFITFFCVKRTTSVGTRLGVEFSLKAERAGWRLASPKYTLVVSP